MNDPMNTARTAILALLQGGEPDQQQQYGDWAAVLTVLHEAHAQGGTDAVQRAFQAAARSHRDLAALVSGTSPSPTTAQPMPPLPDHITALLDQSSPCGAWLDDYIAFARRASPATPAKFHEAAGLFAVATAIARRLVFRFGAIEHYPNIYALFIAPPGRYAKSVGLSLVYDLLDRAGLSYLLLPESNTPESLLQQMSIVVPANLDRYSEAERKRWIKQRAQASQRAWLLDEAGFLFRDLQKDYMAALVGLLLKLYDNPARGLDRETIGHGRVSVTDASLSFFGATTPKSMEAHLRDERLWDEGMWSRFALLIADTAPVWAQTPDEVVMPPALVVRLQQIDDLFPKPQAELVDDQKDKPPFVKLYGQSAPSSVAIARDVIRAWDSYRKTMQFDIPQAGLEETLYASYSRFPAQVIRVAMLLATMDCTELPVRLELRHLARAIAIVERWRADIHRLWSDGIQTEETKLADRVVAFLRQSSPIGRTKRDVCMQLRKPAKEVQDALEVLRLAGQVDVMDTKSANGRNVQIWMAV